MDGIRNGFKVTTKDYDQSKKRQENYKSALCPENRAAVEAQILTEIRNGRYVVTEEPPVLISALAAIPKPGGEGKIRLIHDCSRPEGSALNDYADADKFSYQTVKDAVDMMCPGDFLGKIDLSNAYRSVKVHPTDFPLLGLSWKFKGDNHTTYLQETRLPFGARRAPLLYNQLTQAVREIMAEQGFPRVVAYLDDFLCVGSTREECAATMTRLMGLLRCLGFAINYNKVQGPTQTIVFLGIEIDSVRFQLRLPDNKLHDLKTEVTRCLESHHLSKRELQSVVGKLGWAAHVILGGRVHMRRFID